MTHHDSSAEGDAGIPVLLRLGDRVTVLPIIHGSGQFAWLTRRFMLEHAFDCLAVPLPPSFADVVESAVLDLPRPSIVIQRNGPDFGDVDSVFRPPPPFDPSASDDDDEQDEDGEAVASFVPIDPCQSVIMAIRAAMGEHIPRHYIDLETATFQPFSTVMPDPYAVRHVRVEKFAAAVLPSIPRPADSQTRDRMTYMASQLQLLESKYQRILLVTSVLHWPWIREADRLLRAGTLDPVSSMDIDDVPNPMRFDVDPKTLVFLLGELPFITALYERARADLEDDEDLQIDGVKELLIASRDRYQAELGNRARRITPLLLSKCLHYIRNLSLMHRRMTPDMITIVTATKQILGDQFALHVAETANHYQLEVKSDSGHDDDSVDSDTPSAFAPTLDPFESSHGELNAPLNLTEERPVTLGIDQARLPDGDVVSTVSRLPGPPVMWQTLELQRRPTVDEKARWEFRWNPYSQCSYPPEDERIELLRTRVCQRAQAILGQDLAQTEKFTTSVKDGIDIRDTLRHWYEKSIYVKVLPPSRGKLDACLMLFDSPADPRDYPWRTTWFAEHEWESTLAFFASDFRTEMVGPGIGVSVYGGAMFMYPPIPIRDIWLDRRLNFTETLEERLIAAACLHSRCRQVALLSALPPGGGWRRLAARFKKQLIHVPMTSFSDEEVQQLRMVHVLNGSEVRSYAADFIRRI
ncbi:MAG: hypothetical protein AAGJ40_10295 [Planctomycetota bacterium]